MKGRQMLDKRTRTAILELGKKGHGKRKIARLVGVSKNSVKTVLKQGTEEVPLIEKESFLADYTERIEELTIECEGNLVRVHEKLHDDFKDKGKNIVVGYSTLTNFCRNNEIGDSSKKKSSGEYHFKPGQEMQHDTSPHTVKVDEKKRKLQCASVILCFSRMIYMQVYEVFNRFIDKVFLTEAVKFFDGAAKSCMIDNTHVVVVSGTGKNAKMSPEMEAFGKRFGFTFNAHAVGHANRSGRVERPFHYIEHNFYPGREFKSLTDLNVQAIEWCTRSNNMYRRRLRASPLELFQRERHHLQKLPCYIPEIDKIFHRSVDLYGYVSLHSNRYSAPDDYIGRQVTVRETKGKVQILKGHKLLAEHDKKEYGAGERSRLSGHSRKGRWSVKKSDGRMAKEEGALKCAAPEFGEFISALKKKHGARSSRLIRKLYKLFLEYPNEAIIPSVQRALKYGQLDIHRLETIILKNIADIYFNLSASEEDYDD
jgi:transposase